MILPDNETRVDLLNNEAIAKTIIELLRAQPKQPVTIGVHGDWGAGKSSILEMIEAGLSSDSEILCLKFNGWRFQGFEDAKIALIEGIVGGLIAKRPTLTKATQAVKDIAHRIDWLKVAKHAGGLALTAFTGIPTIEQMRGITAGLEAIAQNPAELATKENITASIEALKSVIKPSESKSVPEEISEFRKAFDKLLAEAGVKQLVVLIDDLDRCLPDTAIETLEAIRLFVFTSGTAFVVAADEAMIEYAVRKHFPELPDTTGPRDYARNYLEKLIQVPFRIPSLGETETRIYVSLLLIGAEIGEGDSAYAKLIEAAREKLKRPWEAVPLGGELINSALGEKAGKASNALSLSEQIGPILATGAKGNPRQIKRFLNSLLLRKSTADARGFGNEVQLPVLAKLMLAERFIPRLFEQIAFAAAAHPKGYCEDLAAFEKSVKESEDNAKKARPDKDAVSDDLHENPVVAEWLLSPSVQAWFKVGPTLTNVDLRPYLFVTKDRKDYFGAVSALGHLLAVVEKLLGPKLSVQAQEADLKRLASPEAAQIFEAIRQRILGAGAFDREPAGMAGLMVLVRAQPNLQNSLVDLLGNLPSEKCGAWIVSGWQNVITEAAASARLTKLIEDWATSKNTVLKTAASGALKVRARTV